MADEKRRIIVREILFWKEHRMLPDHYCDYLLTLYTEGEEMPKDSVESMPPWPFVLMSQILAVCSIVISLFVLYFTELSFPLQMMILTIFVVCVLAAIIYFSKKEFFLRCY